MPEVTKSLDVPVPAIQVWKALADFGAIDRFHPGLTGSHLKGEQASGVGTIRQCYLSGGGHIIEKVIDWKEGESYTIEVTETSLPLKRARTTLSVVSTDANTSRVSMTIDYVPKHGAIGKRRQGSYEKRRGEQALAMRAASVSSSMVDDLLSAPAAS